jgi:hypothetical protein
MTPPSPQEIEEALSNLRNQSKSCEADADMVAAALREARAALAAANMTNYRTRADEAESRVEELERCYACAKNTNGPRSQCLECWTAIEQAKMKAESALSSQAESLRIAREALEAVTPEFEKHMMELPSRGDIQVLQKCLKALSALPQASNERKRL